MIRSAKALCLVWVTALLPANTAMAREICQSYVVTADDTLRKIARKLYGDPELSELIYDANRAVIGFDANFLVVGTKLKIPCVSGTATAATPPPEPAKPTTAPEPAEPAKAPDPAKPPVQPAPTPPVAAAETPEKPADSNVAAATTPAQDPPGDMIRVITANGYPPLSDEALPGGGLFTQIVEMAIFRADPDQPYALAFVNDWQAHLDTLLPSQAYDLSFPWVRPACETPGALSKPDLALCTDYVFSTTSYQITEGFFAASGSYLATTRNYKSFLGKRICRPEALTTGVLDSQGLTPAKVTLTRPAGAEACFAALATGKVDLVSVDIALGKALLKQMALSGKFRQNPYLTSPLAVHAIAYKANPHAVKALKLLDDGALKMKRTGEWNDLLATAPAAD